MKIILSLIAVCSLLSGCVTSSTPKAPGPVVQSNWDSQKTAIVVQVAAQVATHFAIQKEPDAVPYLKAAVIAINLAANNGQVDPAQLRETLLAIKVNEIHSNDAIVGIDAALQLYQIAFGEAVTSKLDQAATMKPILLALAAGIQSAIDLP